MPAFPSDITVGDLLGLGITLRPEQEASLEDPRGLVVALFNLPDPQPESGMVFHRNNKPLVVPMVLELCSPNEGYSDDLTLAEMLFGQPAKRAQQVADLSLLSLPSAIGELSLGSEEYAWRGTEIMDEHHAKPAWDFFPVTQEEADIITSAHLKGLEDIAYLELTDYISWENGYCEPAHVEAAQWVMDLVEDDTGCARDVDDFPPYELILPADLRYKWERLKDESQQAWTSIGLTLPDEKSLRFFQGTDYTPHGKVCPWF